MHAYTCFMTLGVLCTCLKRWGDDVSRVCLNLLPLGPTSNRLHSTNIPPFSSSAPMTLTTNAKAASSQEDQARPSNVFWTRERVLAIEHTIYVITTEESVIRGRIEGLKARLTSLPFGTDSFSKRLTAFEDMFARIRKVGSYPCINAHILTL